MAAITHPGLQVPSVTWPSRPAARRRPLPASVYWRRRAAVAAAALALVLALSWAVGALGGGSLAASGDAAPATVSLQMQPVAQATYVVAPGDTLWSIARHLVPEGDVRPVVDALAADRDGRPLQVGERLVVELP